jgi:hypothetical protein
MNSFADNARSRTSPCSSASQRGSRSAPAFLLLALLIGLGACVGPMDPIVTEQPEDRDPTTDPTDGTAFGGWMSEAEFAFAVTPNADHSFG